MKKVLPFLLVIAFLFTGCEIKNYTPELPLTFDEKVKVISGDFSYNCRICKFQSGEIQVEVTSTNAKGLVMKYDGENLEFTYSDYTYTVDGSNFERRNPAIVVYEVFECVENAREIRASKTDTGYEYNGKITLGDFNLFLREDNSVSLITVKSAGLVMEFGS